MVDGLLNKKIAFIIQARMQSTRLPGKIMMPLPFGGSEPLIGCIVKSLQKSAFRHVITIATSNQPENEVLVSFCKYYKVAFFRGSEDDVLSRFSTIVSNSDCEVVVRLTADNPFVDIQLLDTAIENHILSGADYSTTQGLPLGMNFEIVSAPSLLSLSSKNLTPDDKEHVTLFLKRSGLYQLNVVRLFEEKKYDSLRLTVDYPSDYLVASALYTISLAAGIPPGIGLIDYCLQHYPWVLNSNAHHFQKGNYTDLADELKHVRSILEALECKKTLSLLDSQMPQK
ncbi:MAG: spore coat protein [Flavobacterium sp.]|nr:MAG: spore coat protein [Flavobacterium sp.] [Flavobacterium sp. FEMGT703F]